MRVGRTEQAFSLAGLCFILAAASAAAMVVILLLLPDARAGVTGTTFPTSYQWTTLTSGLAPFVDREHTVSTVPDALGGVPFLRTANDDKRNADVARVRFTLDAPATVLLFYDPRGGPRDWLADWTKTGDTLALDEGDKQTVYTAYSKDFDAGEVTLPGPGYPLGSPTASNYWVALVGEAKPCEDCVPEGAVTLKLSWAANAAEEKVIDYSVYRGEDPQASTLLGTVSKTETAHDAAALGLKWDDTVCFRVKARNDAGYSDYSEAACTTLDLELTPDELEPPSTPHRIRIDVTLSISD